MNAQRATSSHIPISQISDRQARVNRLGAEDDSLMRESRPRCGKRGIPRWPKDGSHMPGRCRSCSCSTCWEMVWWRSIVACSCSTRGRRGRSRSRGAPSAAQPSRRARAPAWVPSSRMRNTAAFTSGLRFVRRRRSRLPSHGITRTVMPCEGRDLDRDDCEGSCDAR